MSQSDAETQQFENFEEKLDELNDALLTAYAAGYAKAVEDADNHDAPTTDVEALKKMDYIGECHYYFWDGRVKPLEFWLREQFDISTEDY